MYALHGGDDVSSCDWSLRTWASVHCGGGGLGMTTSVDWKQRHASDDVVDPDPDASYLLVTAGDDGSIRTVVAAESRLAIHAVIAHAHDLEIWTVACDPWRHEVVWSGGDDAALKAWDFRCCAATSSPVASNRHTHGAGVTSVAPSPHDPHVIVTGSYDDTVRVWDNRRLHHPVGAVGVGGGAWRCRWHPSKKNKVAVAAMGGGGVIVDVDVSAGVNPVAVSRAYHRHASIVYGADFLRGENDDGASARRDDDVIVSCAFYDKSVHVWA